ncbi:UNVERIFIED_CONTAM: hypothetical protein HDU68_008253 [Siphonaria sp. JEL0065]|nr:hypothetical protein HDU68_008253 [Siphonaria sp. JEL0065]
MFAQQSSRNLSSNAASKSGLSSVSALSASGLSASGLSRMAFMSSKEALQVMGSNFQLNNVVPEEEEEEEEESGGGTTCERGSSALNGGSELRSKITSHSNIMNRSATNVKSSTSQIGNQDSSTYRKSPLCEPVKSGIESDDDDDDDDDNDLIHSGFYDRHSLGGSSSVQGPSISIIVRSTSERKVRRSTGSPVGSPHKPTSEDFQAGTNLVTPDLESEVVLPTMESSSPLVEAIPIDEKKEVAKKLEEEKCVAENAANAKPVEKPEIRNVAQKAVSEEPKPTIRSKRDLRRVGMEETITLDEECKKLIGSDVDDRELLMAEKRRERSKWGIKLWFANLWRQIVRVFSRA